MSDLNTLVHAVADGLVPIATAAVGPLKKVHRFYTPLSYATQPGSLALPALSVAVIRSEYQPVATPAEFSVTDRMLVALTLSDKGAVKRGAVQVEAAEALFDAAQALIDEIMTWTAAGEVPGGPASRCYSTSIGSVRYPPDEGGVLNALIEVNIKRWEAA